MPETLIALEGGLDTRSASINAPKGTASNMVNWIKDQGPGMVRRLGWARYDGCVQGPEIDDGIVVFINPLLLVGTFQYGEQVIFVSAGRSNLNAFYLGTVNLGGSLGTAMCFAYPVQPFTSWDDPTTYPTATAITGLSSGANVPSLLLAPTLMNASTIPVLAYDGLKGAIQNAHASSVGAVPGRNESPVDCAFTFSDKSYAIHDCMVLTFYAGSTVTPLEGHVLVNSADGVVVGKILAINTKTGSWPTFDATGTVVIYDHAVGLALPAVNSFFDLYSADGTTLVQTRVMRYNGLGDPQDTRALIYSTYEQYVKNYPTKQFGQTIIDAPPWIGNFGPPTWARVSLTRELPYTCVGTASGNGGFGPQGTNAYSIYEYSRQGMTQDIANLSPVTTAQTFPTIATDLSGTGAWTNPNNILVQDGNVATSPALANGNVTSYLRGTAFDFSSIPEGSTILGVEVTLRAKSTLVSTYKDYDIRLTSSAFPNGMGAMNKARSAFVTNALADYVYGSSTDLWGETALTDTIVRDPSFGFVARWQKYTAGVSTAQVDAYSIKVTYVPPTRTVYIRDQTIAGAPSQDIVAKVVHYSIDGGKFADQTATGVLTLVMDGAEYAGTAAGKIRRLATGNEIRTQPSNPATNAAAGNLLAYVAAEDYPVSYPPSYALDAVSSRYEVIDANFWSSTDGRAAYLANGSEYASMFDGTYVVRIRSGRPTAQDNPRHLAAHLGFLHLGFDSGTIIFTGQGHPLSVLGQLTSGVYNFGEPITGMLTLNGQTLGVWTDRATRGLQGNSPTTTGGGSGYTPIMISPAINCIEYTLVNLIGEAVWCSYRGVETVRTITAYGDFETLPLSAPAQTWLKGRLQVDLIIGSRPSRALYAIGVRNERQYRVFFEDGFAFTLTLFDAGDLPVCTIQQYARPNARGNFTGANTQPINAGVVRHLYNGTLSDGKELIFACFENQNPDVVPASGVGTSTGPYFPYVARLDCGYLDDFAPYMPNWIEFNAFYAGYPSQQQKWGTVTLFLNAYGNTQVTFMSKLDFDGPIFEYTYIKDTLVPSDTLVQSRTFVLPNTEQKAYIPVPQRYMTTTIGGQGRCLKLLIDGTQTGAFTGIAPARTPFRITHLSLETDPLKTDKN